jgi:hypothetical protein
VCACYATPSNFSWMADLLATPRSRPCSTTTILSPLHSVPGQSQPRLSVAMSPTSSTAAMSLTSAVLIEPQQEPLHHSCHPHHRTRHGFGDQRASSPSSSTMESARCSECQQHATNANVSGQEQSYLMELEVLLQFK